MDSRQVVESKKNFLARIAEESIEQMFALGYMEGVKDASINASAAQLKAAAKAASLMLTSKDALDDLLKDIKGETEDE